MGWKEFFKPTIAKIILFLILIIITSMPPNIMIYGADIGLNYGFPFNFYGCCGGPELKVGQTIPSYFYFQNLIFDIIIWYLVSCLIIFIYNKLNRRRRKK